MSNGTKSRQEITQLAELLGAVAEQVRTARIEELRGDVSTLAEVVGATSESLRIVVDEFKASDVPGLRASHVALSADVSEKLQAVRDAIEAKRAELSALIDEAMAKGEAEASVVSAQLEAASLRLGAIESDCLQLRDKFAAALERAKAEIEAELANKVNVSDLSKFRASSAESAAKLSETVETMRALFSAQHEQRGSDIADLRRSFAAQIPITFGGIWEQGKSYPQNCVVSFYGGLWVSVRATSAKPAKKSADWFPIISFRGGGGGGGGDSLPSQSGQGGKFLKTDGTTLTWAAIAGGGDMLAANNLSDVTDAATAFGNIKQRASTTYSGVVTLASDGGTTAGTVVQATDARLTDARTPTAHATSHKSGGSDSIKLDELAAPTDVTTLNSTTAAHGLLPKLSGSTTVFLRGDGSWAAPAGGGDVATDAIWDAKGDLAVGTGADTAVRVPIGADGKFLKASSTDTAGVTWATVGGGGDLISTNNLSDVASALTSFNNIKQSATTTYAGVVSLASSGGTTAGTVVQATDSRLTDSRTPTAHATSHKSGGSDSIKLDELAAPTDVTTLNSTTAAHGLLPKLSGATTAFLRGDGTWSTPAGVATDTIWDAKGDLIAATGADAAVRVPIGADGKYLKASSADAAGITWATISGGGDMLAANNLSDVVSALTSFNNIKQSATTTYGGVVSLAADRSTTASCAVQANDSRLAVSTTSGAGLLPSLTASTTVFLRGDGAWATPSGGGITSGDSVTWTGAHNFGSATLQLPSVTVSVTARARWNQTEAVINVYDGQRERAVGVRGWQAYAFPANGDGGTVYTTTASLAANGGTVVTQIPVWGHMRIRSVSFRNVDASGTRTMEFQLYQQRLNDANASESIVESVTGVNGSDSFTASAASNRIVQLASPVYIAPGVYWIAVRNTSASLTWSFGTASASNQMVVNTAKTKTIGSTLSATLDLNRPTWAVSSSRYGIRLDGTILGQSTTY